WSDAEAKDFVARYAASGVNEDLALRTYTTRLLGSDPKLVLHGGGNTSVKTCARDLLGEEVEVICVKGSGWDMGSIEPQGLPAGRRVADGADSSRSVACESSQSSPTRTWSISSASIFSILPRQTRRSRRCCTRSCRTNSSTTRIRLRCSR